MGDANELCDNHAGNDGIVTTDSLLPMVEMYETIEGEGARAGFPTVFVRVYGCNLRCVWCDTPYSYAPVQAEQSLTIAQIVEQASAFSAEQLCLTGGEPLMYGAKSLLLLQSLANSPKFRDIHVETNGAIDLAPFIEQVDAPHVRYVMDYKLSGSGECEGMVHSNLAHLRPQDELKFVIADEADFAQACHILSTVECAAQVLFSPVWETMSPARLAALILQHRLVDVRMSLQLHKLIWEPHARGV